jgi:hypothetical protein
MKLIYYVDGCFGGTAQLVGQRNENHKARKITLVGGLVWVDSVVGSGKTSPAAHGQSVDFTRHCNTLCL